MENNKKESKKNWDEPEMAPENPDPLVGNDGISEPLPDEEEPPQNKESADDSPPESDDSESKETGSEEDSEDKEY